ncbi:MAG TPA: hypothetical protein VFZ25_02910 [Chloroflexota bacterium]|nr:hypothetical protein [Chloroflexota bacterium]
MIDEIVRVATRVVRKRFGDDVSLRDARVVAARERNLVVRCDLTPGHAAPCSVIVKQHLADATRGFSDWASLAFISTLDDARGIAPVFYGGDAAARLFVMEDLSGSGTLADVIAAGDVVAIRGTLRLLAEPMARLVAATAGSLREASYRRLRRGLPGGRGQGRHQEAVHWSAGWPKVAAWFDTLGCPIGKEFEAGFRRVANSYAEPGPFLAFSHGDPAPSNNHVSPAAVRLLDFEYGAYRHALYDITGWYVLCPLPETWEAELHRDFRQLLMGEWAPAADEAAYSAAWAEMCAYRALAMLSWLPLDVVSADRPWVDDWTMRGALVTAATRLGRACTDLPGLEALGEAGHRLAQAARRRWPEVGTGLPRWPDIRHDSSDASPPSP